MSPSPSPFPFTTPGALPGISGVAYAVGVLFLVCAAAYITVKFLYGRGPMNRFRFGKKQLLRVIERYPLAPQRYLLIVEITGKFYLLGVTDQSINMLAPLDGEALAKDLSWSGQNGDSPTPFNAYLNALSRRWKKNKKEPPDVV